MLYFPKVDDSSGPGYKGTTERFAASKARVLDETAARPAPQRAEIQTSCRPDPLVTSA
jgi:hypothetical protein